MNGLNGFEFGVLVIVALMCALPVAIVAWHGAVTNKRLHAQNRDLIKANLALSERPVPTSLATAMENTDRADVEGEHMAERAKHDNGRLVRRPAGAG